MYCKAGTGRPSIPYGDSVEEALCFGWIDSLIKRLDGQRYLRKFTPRTDAARWSAANIARARQLIAGEQMTEAGLAKIATGVLKRKAVPSPKRPPGVPGYIRDALRRNIKARDAFYSLAPGYRRQYLGWIDNAVRTEAKMSRLREAISLLTKGQKLGMK